ncbi:MAG TPA: NADH-quinone oxidoreductase subunit NuoK [Polyangiales bacterium]
MGLSAYLMLAAALFSVGLYGVLTRRNAVAVLASIELMANAANINLAAFSRFRAEATGQVFALFSTAITVAEVVVGLSLVILLYRSRGNVLLESASDLKG